MADPRIWFITGCSRGLGRSLAEAVLRHGDCVIATARQRETLDALAAQAPDRVLALSLDVDQTQAIPAACEQALQRFGRIDVLVNNAGYGLAGAVEELSDEEARAQFETNVFGALALTRAVLPQMRAQGSGHVLQISSVAGQVGTPGLGLYNASKFALEGFSEALAHEVRGFGIRITLIEPGPFRTDWAGPSLATPAQRIDAYQASAHKTIDMLNGYSGQQPGDPEKAAAAMIQVVEADAPPLRLPLGKMAVQRIRDKLAQQLRELDDWAAVATGADYD